MLQIIYKFIMHFLKILTETVNLHLPITVEQQYNASEQCEVMKL